MQENTRTQSYTCRNCQVQWARKAARGQVPKWCPSCRDLYREKRCFQCSEIKPITSGSKRCRECVELLRPRKSTALAIYKPSQQNSVVVHVRTKSRLTSGQCRVCSHWFVSHHTDVTCSPECFDIRRREQRRIDRDRRRATKRNAFVENVYRKKVFSADGYRCHLCGKKTDKTKSVPHPKAPTIDHITPLALGGTHEPANCRTACFKCNATKSHRLAGDQLLLLAV